MSDSRSVVVSQLVDTLLKQFPGEKTVNYPVIAPVIAKYRDGAGHKAHTSMIDWLNLVEEVRSEFAKRRQSGRYVHVHINS